MRKTTWFILAATLLGVIASADAAEKQLENFQNKEALFIRAFGCELKTVSEKTRTIPGAGILRLDYKSNGEKEAGVEVTKIYGTNTLDLSFQPAGLSLWVKGNRGSRDHLQIFLYEDHAMNGKCALPEDEVWMCENSTVLSQDQWTKVSIPFASFTRFTGEGDHKLNLDRIGEWTLRVVLFSSGASARTARFTDLKFRSSAKAPVNNSILSGAWLRLGQGPACQRAEWTVQQWEDELQAMRDLYMGTVILEAAMDDHASWYPSRLSWAKGRRFTLDRVMKAAAKKDMKIVIGLYSSKDWDRSDKDLPQTYASLAREQKLVIDELWERYGENPALAGFYIPQPVDDQGWQGDTARDLLAGYWKEVSAYAKSKKKDLLVVVAPVFGPHRPADFEEAWWDRVLAIAGDVDTVLLEDGVGSGRTTAGVDVPQYFQAVKKACVRQGRTFGATVDLFHRRGEGPLKDEPAKIDDLITQLAAAGSITPMLFGLEWGDMQSCAGEQQRRLSNNYKAYVESVRSHHKAARPSKR